MSIHNVRKHWKGLALIALAFAFIAALGPIILFGLPWLFETVRDANPWLGLLLIPVLIVGYIVGAYALMWRSDIGTEKLNSESSNG